MFDVLVIAGLAQSVERQALNLMVEGSSPSVGDIFFNIYFSIKYFILLQYLMLNITDIPH